VWKVTKRSTKGQRRTTTVKPIKCLLLLAAVLSFAAMNAAAMDADDMDAAAVDAIDMINEAARPTVAEVDARANNGRFKPDDYQLRQNEDGDFCRPYSCMGYAECLLCCIVFSWQRGLHPPWQVYQPAYINYRGRCICRITPPHSPRITEVAYKKALRGLRGVIVNPRRENRNNRNQK
jgi:hypothetical protein